MRHLAHCGETHLWIDLFLEDTAKITTAKFDINNGEKFVMKKNRMLLIVDPQVDFINGTLPVPGAEEAMNQLAQYVAQHDGDYAVKVVTSDWHPYGHCSFVPNGGQWPAHCVQHTVGAAIWPALVEPLYATQGDVHILRKGTSPTHEEYSVFGNADLRTEFSNLMEHYAIDQIDICGIAGDICVLYTLKDAVALYGSERFEVLTQYAPSLDGGEALQQFINNQLK